MNDLLATAGRFVSKPECSSRPSEQKPFLPVQACLVHQEIEQIHGDNAFLIT